MAVGGYRVTEASDQRVLEDGSLRVTENLFSVESSINATSSYDFVPKLKATGSLNVSGNGNIAATGLVTKYAAILVANNSSISADAIRTTVGEFAGAASGTLVSVSKTTASGVSSLNAVGTMVAAARTVKYVFFLSGTSTFDRITEEEDYRITENGDSRITNDITVNEMDSSLVAEATLVPFSNTAYYKENGVWKTAVVSTKYNNDWDALLAVYKKISGSWKRIY